MSCPRPLPALVLGLTLALAGGLALTGHLPAAAAASSPGLATAVAGAVAGPVVAAPVAAAAPAPAPAAAAAPVVPAPLRELLAEQEAAGLTCRASLAGTPLCAHGEDAPGHPLHAAASTGGSGTGAGQLGCYGDGTSGPRVRAVYARPEGSPDRFAASLPSFAGWAAGVSGQVDESARATGGRRHVRFATTAGASCSLVVTPVVLPAAAFTSFWATVEALQARGFTAPSSKYLVWADTSASCGTATTFADDRPGPNLNDSSSPGYARIDRPCWGAVEAHELVHMLGGVQRSARNSTGGFHCNDGSDVLCYADGSADSTQRAVCPTSRARLLDCGNDDYFSTAPPAGSYLATHWNTASSSLLAPGLSDPAPPPPAPADPSPSPSASPSPSPSPSASTTTGTLLPPLLSTVRNLTAPRPAVPAASPAPALVAGATALLGR